MTKLQFHGVAYDSARHEQPSGNPVQHTYRGQRLMRLCAMTPPPCSPPPCRIGARCTSAAAPLPPR